MNLFYSFFKLLIKISLRFYFHKIKIEGLENVPKNTPLIVTPNHQNAFLDALLVGAFIPIPLHYLARQDVFNRWSTPLLRLLQMIPIYRIRDGYSKLSLNDSIFDVCRNLFASHGSVLIFAEGNHGINHYLRPLTKGAARLALQSENIDGNEIMILPVGLNYFNHQSSNSTVLINFGKPISVKTYLSIYSDNHARGLIEMRDAISRGMQNVLVIPEETVDYKQLVKAVFQEKNEDLTFDELRAINSAASIEVPKKRMHLIARILNPIPFLIVRYIINKVDDIVFHSSLKFSVGLFLFPLWWLLIFCFLFLTVGINIAMLSVTVMIFGLYYSYLR